MSFQDDITILGEIVAFGAEVWAKPIGMDSVERREHLAFLAQKFAEREAESSYRYIMARRAPMLLTSIKGALDARRLADAPLASDFERIIGLLVPGVRQDIDAVLARAKE